VINTFFMEKNASYKVRIVATGIFMVLSLFGLAVALYFYFWLCLLAILAIGAASSFGESVILGCLSEYDSKLVGGWSSGTGMAGFFGSLLYILLVTLKLPLEAIYACCGIVSFMYFISYFFIVTKPTHVAIIDDAAITETQLNNVPMAIKENTIDLEKEEAADVITYTVPIVETKLQRTIRCAILVWYYSLTLSSVYFFEYIISSGCAAKTVSSTTSYADANAYALLGLCYQVGVLISRSSLSIVKIRFLGVLTFLQFLNLILWIAIAYFKFVNIYIQFGLMIFVGLLGGASYVNTFHLILKDEKINETDRDFCVNICAMFYTVGIILASVAIVVLDQTLLKSK